MIPKDIGYGYGEPRPAAITAICLLGFFASLIEIFVILFVPRATYYTILYYNKYHHYAVIIINLLLIISYIGLWRMKLWGFILFALSFACIMFYSYFIGQFAYGAILPGVIILIVCLLYFKNMS